MTYYIPKLIPYNIGFKVPVEGESFENIDRAFTKLKLMFEQFNSTDCDLLIYEFSSKPYVKIYEYSKVTLELINENVSYNNGDFPWLMRKSGDEKPEAGTKFKAGDVIETESGHGFIGNTPGKLTPENGYKWENVYLINIIIDGERDHIHLHESEIKKAADNDNISEELLDWMHEIIEESAAWEG